MNKPSHPIAGLLTGITIALASLPVAAQQCVKPEASEIVIPNAQTATRDEMLAAQQAVNVYVEQMNDYLACLDERSTALPEGADGDRARAINDARYNAARDELQRLAEQFNTQVRAWKVRQERPD